MKSPSHHLLVAATTLIAASALSSIAQVASWINPAGGAFHESVNYADGQAPTSEIPVEFNEVDGAYTVHLQQSATVGHFFNRGGDVTFNLGGNTLSILNALGANSFNLDGGLSGGETIFTGGGTVENAGAANIGGGESEFSRHVIFESGTVFSNTGGSVSIGTRGVFPGDFNNVAAVTVRDGASMALGTSTLHVGRGTSNSTLTLTGAGSKLTLSGNLFVGREGTGTGSSMFIEDGAWLDTNGIQVGRGAQDNGLLIIDGADTRVDAAFFQVGANPSTGNVVEQRGGLLRLDPSQGTNQNTYLLINTAGNHVRLMGGETRVQRDIAPNINRGYARSIAGSKITVEGGHLVVDELRITTNTDTPVEFLHGSITALRADYNPASAPLIVGDGSSATATYRMTGGNHNFGAASGLIIESNGELRGTGTINGAVTIRGSFQPDALVTANGAVTFDGGSFVADLENSAGTVTFSQPVTLTGAQLVLQASSSFTPAVGTQYIVATFGNEIIGSFANAQPGQVLRAGGAYLEVSYFSWTSLSLTVVEPPPVVEGSFAAWANHYNLTTNDGPADDVAGDGIPNLVKYALGLDPREPTTLPTATFTEVNGQQYLTLNIDRDPNAIEAKIEAEVSTDLNDWKVEEVQVIDEPDHLTFRDTLPVGTQDRRFLRLRVTLTSQEP